MGTAYLTITPRTKFKEDVFKGQHEHWQANKRMEQNPSELSNSSTKQHCVWVAQYTFQQQNAQLFHGAFNSSLAARAHSLIKERTSFQNKYASENVLVVNKIIFDTPPPIPVRFWRCDPFRAIHSFINILQVAISWSDQKLHRRPSPLLQHTILLRQRRPEYNRISLPRSQMEWAVTAWAHVWPSRTRPVHTFARHTWARQNAFSARRSSYLAVWTSRPRSSQTQLSKPIEASNLPRLRSDRPKTK